MSKTRDQLIRKALQKLEVVAGDEPVGASDNTNVGDMIDPMLNDLELRGVWSTGQPDTFDDSAFPWLAMILSVLCAEDYGKVPNFDLMTAAEKRLASQSQQGYTSYSVVQNYL